jgi:hypothetical protein
MLLAIAVSEVRGNLSIGGNEKLRPCGSVVSCGNMLQAGRSRVQFPMKSLDFSIDLILLAHCGPGVDLASNRNEHEESSLRKGRPAHKADNLTAICGPIFYKM